MAREKILILVKTYPRPSDKYLETVCTAGMRKDGSWVRLYPIPYRRLDSTQKFSKYQWVEADIERNLSDPRPESYKLVGKVKPLNRLSTYNGWRYRKSIVQRNVYTNLQTLIDEARDVNCFISLATFKPTKIIKFHMERDHTTKDMKRKRHILQKQLNKEQAQRLAEHVPYTFHYTFVDDEGKRSSLQILDWEIYQLCRKLIRKYGRKKSLIYQHLKAKYFDEFVGKRDIHLFLGTNKYWHTRRSKNPFMIVGIFYPPK